jgi:hypothetical protein
MRTGFIPRPRVSRYNARLVPKTAPVVSKHPLVVAYLAQLV